MLEKVVAGAVLAVALALYFAALRASPAPVVRPAGVQVPPDRGSDPSVSGRPPSNPALQGAPSGVYTSRSQAEAARADALRTTGGTRQGQRGGPGSAKPNTWLLLLVLGVTAVAASVVAAWLLH